MTTSTLLINTVYPLQDIRDEIKFLDSMLYCEVFGVDKQKFMLNNPWNLSMNILKYKVKYSEYVYEFEQLDDRKDLLGRLINEMNRLESICKDCEQQSKLTRFIKTLFKKIFN